CALRVQVRLSTTVIWRFRKSSSVPRLMPSNAFARAKERSTNVMIPRRGPLSVFDGKSADSGRGTPPPKPSRILRYVASFRVQLSRASFTSFELKTCVEPKVKYLVLVPSWLYCDRACVLRDCCRDGAEL